MRSLLLTALEVAMNLSLSTIYNGHDPLSVGLIHAHNTEPHSSRKPFVEALNEKKKDKIKLELANAQFELVMAIFTTKTKAWNFPTLNTPKIYHGLLLTK